MSIDGSAAPGRARGRRDHRHEETGSGEPLILAMNKTFVADRLSSPKESHPDRTRRPGTGLLALTFGTLLSSQGTDAHQSGSHDPSWGNRSTPCPSPPAVKP